MATSELAEAQPTDLKAALGRQIEHRTDGRIRLLHVDVQSDRIVVAGTAPSYHLKQLALEAVLDVIRTRVTPPVALRIRVDPDFSALLLNDSE